MAMYQVIAPAIVDESSFEYLTQQISSLENIADKEIAVDLRHTESIDCYGLLGILELGRYLKSKNFCTFLTLPRQDYALSFLSESGFFDYAHSGFDISDDSNLKPSDNTNVLLPITPIEKLLDIHDILSKIRERVKYDTYSETLSLWDTLIVIVSEICQNVPEHSQDKGLVMLTQFTEKQHRKKSIRIAVMDLGIGIKNSLDRRFFPIFREKWSDRLAIHNTLFKGISRFEDPGRGNGIIRTREMVEKYGGTISIRSGTAKLWGKIPSWELERLFRRPLTYLPGTQISISLPVTPS